MRRKRTDRERSILKTRKLLESLVMMNAIKPVTYRDSWHSIHDGMKRLYYGSGCKRSARRFNRQNRSDDISTI